LDKKPALVDYRFETCTNAVMFFDVRGLVNRDHANPPEAFLGGILDEGAEKDLHSVRFNPETAWTEFFVNIEDFVFELRRGETARPMVEFEPAVEPIAGNDDDCLAGGAGANAGLFSRCGIAPAVDFEVSNWDSSGHS